MTKPLDSLKIRPAPPKDTSKGKLYAKRQPKRDLRHIQILRLDAITTDALTQAQHLEDLTATGQMFSKTVIIRRAVFSYARQLLHAAQVGNSIFLENEVNALLTMSAPPKKKVIGQ